MVGVDVCHWCDDGGGGGGADDEAAEVAEAGETEEVTHCGEFSSPVVDNEVVGEKTCGGGSSLLCLILHWSSSTYIKCRLDWIQFPAIQIKVCTTGPVFYFYHSD